MEGSYNSISAVWDHRTHSAPCTRVWCQLVCVCFGRDAVPLSLSFSFTHTHTNKQKNKQTNKQKNKKTQTHSDHWRKNLPVLGQHCRVYAIDLLGYGYSSKPDPRRAPPNTIYTFETWGQQTLDFIDEIIGQPTITICNSVGGLVGLQAATQAPDKVPAVMVINISLRMLHVEKQAPWQRPLVSALQQTLRETEIGRWFFSSVAQPQVWSGWVAWFCMCHVMLHVSCDVLCVECFCTCLWDVF